MNAAIISSGSELVTGELVDTNSAFLAEQLTALGLHVQCTLTVGDDRQQLAWAVSQAAEKAQLVVITGGLGPTADDLTRFVLAEATGVQLIERQGLLEQIDAFFRKRSRQMNVLNRIQAHIPQNAEGLENKWGTAPGIKIAIGSATVFALPGVPREMKEMFVTYVKPWISNHTIAPTHRVRLHCLGMGESDVVLAIDPILQQLTQNGIDFGTRAHEGIISLKLAGPDRQAILDFSQQIKAQLGTVVFGEANDTLESVVGQQLRHRRQTLAVAESCTGGYVAKLITDVPGSSEYFLGGWIAYANSFKQRHLAVPPEILETHGAVSPECCAAMLKNLLAQSQADWGIAITGIAGPAGGTPEKPVGLVWIAVGNAANQQIKEHRFGDVGREAVRFRAAIAALNMLRLMLMQSGPQ